MNSNKIITFNVSWFDAIHTLEPETQLKIMSAVFNYISTGEETTLDAVEQAIFNVIKLSIDNSSYTVANSTKPDTNTSRHETPAPQQTPPTEAPEPQQQQSPAQPQPLQAFDDGKHCYVNKDEYIAPKYQKLITAVEGLPGPIKDLFYRIPPKIKPHHMWIMYYLVKCEEENNHDYTATLDNIPDEPEFEPPYVDDDDYVFDYIRPYH